MKMSDWWRWAIGEVERLMKMSDWGRWAIDEDERLRKMSDWWRRTFHPFHIYTNLLSLFSSTVFSLCSSLSQLLPQAFSLCFFPPSQSHHGSLLALSLSLFSLSSLCFSSTQPISRLSSFLPLSFSFYLSLPSPSLSLSTSHFLSLSLSLSPSLFPPLSFSLGLSLSQSFPPLSLFSPPPPLFFLLFFSP